MEEAGNGRQENAIRGEMLLRSGRGNKSEEACLATTEAAEVNPGATFRLTRRPYFSVTGDQYSQRTPAFSVKPGLMRQSSLRNASATELRRYLSALPNAMEAASGTPSRKLAKSFCVVAPVKVKEWPQ